MARLSTGKSLSGERPMVTGRAPTGTCFTNFSSNIRLSLAILSSSCGGILPEPNHRRGPDCSNFKNFLQGLKPGRTGGLTARLKSCPPVYSRQGLKPRPPKELPNPVLSRRRRLLHKRLPHTPIYLRRSQDS